MSEREAPVIACTQYLNLHANKMSTLASSEETTVFTARIYCTQSVTAPDYKWLVEKVIFLIISEQHVIWSWLSYIVEFVCWVKNLSYNNEYKYAAIIHF